MLATLGLALAGCASHPPVSTSPRGAPLFVARSQGELAHPVGFDFALLRDARVVFLRMEGRRRLYFVASLSPSEFSTLQHVVDAPTLEGLVRFTDLDPDASHATTRVVQLWPPWAAEPFVIQVRGSLKLGRESRESAAVLAATRIESLFAYLSSTRFSGEAEWVPETVKVDFVAYGQRSARCSWPENWKLSTAPQNASVPRLIGSTEFLLAGISLNEITRFVEDCGQAVIVDGSVRTVAFWADSPWVED